jgi:hypothetical protein
MWSNELVINWLKEDGFVNPTYVNKINKSVYFEGVDEETEEKVLLELTPRQNEIIVNIRSSKENKWYSLNIINL